MLQISFTNTEEIAPPGAKTPHVGVLTPRKTKVACSETCPALLEKEVEWQHPLSPHHIVKEKVILRNRLYPRERCTKLGRARYGDSFTQNEAEGATYCGALREISGRRAAASV